MADETATPGAASESQKPPAQNDEHFVSFWLGELGRYETEFKAWGQRVGKIIRRYRDERPEFQSMTVKYAILWSNVQTLMPAIYSKPPQPVVERRYLDSDPLGSVSSQTLERAIETSLEVGRFNEAMKRAVLDYLLAGRGQIWTRYEPEYGQATAQISQTKSGEAGEAASPADVGSDGAQEDEPSPEVKWEKVCTDYVHWSDFAHTPARVWPEVWWAARRAWLSMEEGVARFGDIFRKVSLKRPVSEELNRAYGRHDRSPKAEVWEIWDKANGEVVFIAPDLPSQALERVPDPLHLHDYFPCPEPLYATLTNETLVPVPDYAEYQDQAEEIDSLTNRISRIAAALKVVGTYDGSNPQLGRILSATVDNVMIPIDNWAAFAEKGGMDGGTSWLPIKDLAQTLIQLYEAREAAKRDLFEITGMSDIIRGQGVASETATAQRIKGQFASLRLDARRKDVARFTRDIVAICGEIIAEQFSPETIIQMTGMLPVVLEQIESATPSSPPAGAPHAGAGMAAGPQSGVPSPPAAAPSPVSAPPQNGGMQPPMGAPMPAPAPPPPPDPKVLAMQIMAQAIELLRDDKMRTFRIDIEIDSTVEADAVMDKEAVVEFMGAVAQFLGGALPIAQAAPPLIKPLAESLKYAMRRFKMGRSVETAFDTALDELEQMTGQNSGPPPDPAAEAAAAKAKGDIAVAEIQAQVQQRKAQMEMVQMEADMALAQQKAQNEQRKLAIEAEALEMKAAAAQHAHKLAMAAPPANSNRGA